MDRDLTQANPPSDLDWPMWVARWDRMQDRHLVRRAERFAIITRLIQATQPACPVVVDLGCGTGSLSWAVLDACPGATVHSIDFDPFTLWLARARLASARNRVTLTLADLRQADWTNQVPVRVDAVVSATALHWMTAEQLAALYVQVAGLLRPGGIFINADHVGSPDTNIRTCWERHRAGELESVQSRGETWDEF